MANLPLPEGLETPDLECVMIDLPALDVLEAYGEDVDQEDLFYGSVRELQYAQGDVAAGGSHVTMLFGIHPSMTYEQDVYSALDGWDIGEVLVGDVDVFPSRVEGQDYNCLVLRVMPTATLLNGRKRLEALPYTDSYPEYKPHVTLVYLKGTADVGEWKFRMQKAFANKVLPVNGLNLGKD